MIVFAEDSCLSAVPGNLEQEKICEWNVSITDAYPVSLLSAKKSLSLTSRSFIKGWADIFSLLSSFLRIVIKESNL